MKKVPKGENQQYRLSASHVSIAWEVKQLERVSLCSALAENWGLSKSNYLHKYTYQRPQKVFLVLALTHKFQQVGKSENRLYITINLNKVSISVKSLIPTKSHRSKKS